MSRLPLIAPFATHLRFGLYRFAALSVLVSGCHLVVSPNGGDGDGNDSDQSDVEARECGDRTCGEGTECCNASCGICTAPGNVCIQIACEPSDADATCKTVLCGPRDVCMETPAGAVCVPAAENPCNLVDCPSNSTCKVEQGAPVCLLTNGSNGDAGAPTKRDAGAPTPVDAGAPAKDAGQSRNDAGAPLDAGTPNADAGSEHDAGSVRDAGHVKDSGVTPVTCAAVLCPTGTYCDDISGSPQCIPLPSCATVKCSAGYHCELQQVVCVRAPCPPQPQCVPDADPCGGKCKATERCTLLPIQCITTPCDPIAECVPKTTCGCSGKGACLDIVCPALDAY